MHGGEVAAKFSQWLFHGGTPRALSVSELFAARWFVVRNARGDVALMQPRFAMTVLRGPMTLQELCRLAERREEQ